MPVQKKDFSRTCLKWDPDEIPGITTFLQKEHRFRRPEEFIHHRGPDLSMLERTMGTQEMSRHEIIKLLSSAERKKEEVLSKLQILEGDNIDLQIQINYSKKRHKKENDEFLREVEENKTHKSTIKFITVERDKYKENLAKFGDHTIECKYLEAMCVGRKLSSQAEKQLCNCGWIENQEASMVK